MTEFAAYHIRVRARATSPLVLREYVGSALRGAFFEALWRRFCTNQTAPTCAECPLHTVCPVSALVAPLRDEGPRGRDIPRPYAIHAPHTTRGAYGPGHDFSWGLTLFGHQRQLFPYAVMAIHTMAEHGVGQRCADNGWQRGRFTVEEIAAVHPLSGQAQVLQTAGERQVAMPDLPVLAADITHAAERMPLDRLRIRFETPTRITDGGTLVKRPVLRPIVQRLLERLTALMGEFGEGVPHWDFGGLIDQAGCVQLVDDQTRWIDLASYSSRQRRTTPIGGFVGEATYEGDLGALLPVLLWGSVVQVGKDAVKGNGVYNILWN